MLHRRPANNPRIGTRRIHGPRTTGSLRAREKRVWMQDC